MAEWKLVPVKPTQEMKLRVNDNGGPGALAWAMAAYPDMLAAAPSPAEDPALVMTTAHHIAESLGCKHILPRHKAAARAVLAALCWPRFRPCHRPRRDSRHGQQSRPLPRRPGVGGAQRPGRSSC